MDRPRRSWLGTLAFLAVIGASALLAWKLMSDEDAPAKTKRAKPSRDRHVVARFAESLPTSLPTSRPDGDEALALAPEPGSIRGRVVDRGSIPVNHATVRIVLKIPPGQRNFALVASFDEKTKVDHEGRFSQPVPGGGVYQVVAEAEGFAPAIKDGVKPGEEVELLVDVGATLAGTVVDRITGRPIEAAAIEVSIEKGAMLRKLETNAQGEFKLADLPGAKLAINVEHPLYVPKNGIEQVVQAGDAATIRVELDAGKSIKGQVMAADEGRPIEGAILTVRKKKATSDATGRFVIRGLESEMHELQVAADGFQAEQRPINLSGSRVEAVAEIMLNRGATIRGRIQNDKSEPVANAELRLFETWGTWSYEDWATRHLQVKSGEDGTFKMTGIPPREWMQLAIRVRCKGYPETFEKGVKITRVDDDVFVPIMLRAGAVVSGRVVDQENRPVTGARVELRPQNTGGWWMQGAEDPSLIVSGSGVDGEFKFEGLGRATYVLSASVRGYSNAWKNDLNLNEGQSATNILLSVESGSPVRGLVVDVEDKPISGVAINIWTNKGNGTAVSDVEGKFVVEALPKGPYDLYASALGYAATRLQKQTPNTDVGFRIVMKREAVLKGTVVDAQTKKPIEKFTALLSTDDGRPAWRQGRWGGQQSDPGGKFSVQAPQGTYRLEIFANGYVRARKEGVSLQPGTEPEPVKIEMKRGGAIEGIVRGQSGQPEPWVQVFVGKDDGTGTFSNQAFSEHDGYFFVGDLDSGSYTIVFQKHNWPITVMSGVYVGGDKPAFVEAQLETVAIVAFDFVTERPRDDEDKEVVAGAVGDQPIEPPMPAPRLAPAKAWRAPRVRAWVESVGGAPLAINQEWGMNEAKFKPMTRKDLNVPHRQERFSITVKDLPAGQYVLRATARGYYDVRLPFQVRTGSRWRAPVDLKLLPKEQRANLPEDNSGRRRSVWYDENGVQREYWYYYEDE